MVFNLSHPQSTDTKAEKQSPSPPREQQRGLKRSPRIVSHKKRLVARNLPPKRHPAIRDRHFNKAPTSLALIFQQNFDP
ncbi:MAG: hypothetical protein IJM72_07405, partial [Deltaproteobacteria bacterium]|nr:hypothetical protein [Deltaproteobacteria bacterium]